MNVLIHHHLGLGDCFMCNGLVRSILERENCDKIGVFCRHIFSDVVSYMYRDDPRVFVIPIKEFNQEVEQANSIAKSSAFVNYKFIRIGWGAIDIICKEWVDAGKYDPKSKTPWPFDIAFYEEAKIDYQNRWNNWKFCRDLQKEKEILNKLNPENVPYIFVHDDPLRGVNVNINTDLKIIRNDKSINPLHMISVLENAKELHVMESSFKCLIDQNLHLSNPKYLYLDVRPDGAGRNLRSGTKHTWIEVEGR